MAYVGGIEGDIHTRIVLEAIDKTYGVFKQVEQNIKAVDKIAQKATKTPILGNMRLIAQNVKGLQKTVNVYEQIGKAYNRMHVLTEANKASNYGFWKVLRMNYESWKKATEYGMFSERSLSRGARFAHWIRKTTHGLKGFRMEFLSTMFVGLQMRRIAESLLRPAMQLTGISEILSTTLGLMLLPTALALLPIFVQMLNIVIAMPDWIKLMIGGLVLLTFTLGTFMFFVSQAALGMGGLVLTISAGTGVEATATVTTTGLAAAVRTLGAALSTVSFVVGIAILAFMLLSWMWRTNALGIRQYVGVLIKGLAQLLRGFAWLLSIGGPIVMFFADLVITQFGLIYNGIAMFVNGIYSALQFIAGTMGISLPDFSMQMWDFKSTIEWVNKAISDMPKNVFEAAEQIDKLGDNIIKSGQEIDAMKTPMDNLTGSISNATNWTEQLNAKLNELNGKEFYSTYTLYKRIIYGSPTSYNYNRTLAPPPKPPISWNPAETYSILSGMYHDMIWRPGSRPIRISPSDTLIATKSGTGKIINFNPNINIEINATSDVDIELLKNKLSEEWINELKSMVG